MTFAFETELISAINKKLVDQKTVQKRDESQWKSTAEEAQRSRRQRKPNNTRLTNPITMSFGVFVWLISQNVACEAIFSCSLSLSFFGPCVFSSKSDYQFSWCKKMHNLRSLAFIFFFRHVSWHCETISSNGDDLCAWNAINYVSMAKTNNLQLQCRLCELLEFGLTSARAFIISDKIFFFIFSHTREK